MTAHVPTDFWLPALLLTVLALLVIVWALLRRQHPVRRDPFPGAVRLDDVPFERLDSSEPVDAAACRIIERARRSVWEEATAGASVSPEALYDRAQKLVAAIAAAYFPQHPRPVTMVTVHGIVQLLGRTAQRMEGSLGSFPLCLVRDRTISDVLRIHAGYRAVRDTPVGRFLRNRLVRTAGRVVWDAYTIARPWNLGRRMIWAVSREAGLRYLLTLFVTIVGEEAVRVYGGAWRDRADTTAAPDSDPQAVS